MGMIHLTLTFYQLRGALFELTLLDSSCVPGGGADLPTLESLPLDYNFIIFLNRVLSLDGKGQNLKAQPCILKTVLLRFNWKIIVFGKNRILLKIRYL